MLPHVDPEQRRVGVADGRILIRCGVDGQACAVVDEPGPAGTEALHAGVVHRRLQLVEAPERRGDCVGERPRWLPAPVRAHDLPEKAVIRVPAGVVANGGLLVGR